MSQEEFLKRWSRRKQEAKAAEQESLSPASEAQPRADEPATDAEPEIDLSKLPSLDSITATTDVTEFLRKGIPAELGRAALRRAWAADPAIRDFVGLAENAWDFTDPDAMPGFGALHGTSEQISAMVERVLGGARETVEKLAVDSPERGQEQQNPDREPDVPQAVEPPQAAVTAENSSDATTESIAAAQPEASVEDGDVMPVQRRTHGGALPI